MWRRRGFTLTELLVVLCIISILAAILFPAFTRARNLARRTVCMSNIQQLATAVLMYADDHDEVLPWTASWNYAINVTYAFSASYPDGTVPADWRDGDISHLVAPYVRNNDIWYCTLLPRGTDIGRATLVPPRNLGSGWTFGNGPDQEIPSSYYWAHITSGNAYLPEAAPPHAVAGTSLTECENPSVAPMIWDLADWASPFGVHQSAINIAYADGHCKVKLPEPFWDDYGWPEYWVVRSDDGWVYGNPTENPYHRGTP